MDPSPRRLALSGQAHVAVAPPRSLCNSGGRYCAAKEPRSRGTRPRRSLGRDSGGEFASLRRPPKRLCQCNSTDRGMTPTDQATTAIPPADVLRRLAALKIAPTAELKQQWRDLFGKEPALQPNLYRESFDPSRARIGFWRPQTGDDLKTRGPRRESSTAATSCFGVSGLITGPSRARGWYANTAVLSTWSRCSPKALSSRGRPYPFVVCHCSGHYRHALERLDIFRSACAG